MVKKHLPLVFILIFNLWVYQIFSKNFIVGIFTILLSIIFWLAYHNNKKNYLQLGVVFVIIGLFLQYKTSCINSLTFLNENEKLQQQTRLRAYAGKNYILPLANWFELRQESIAFYKLEDNLAEAVDPNLYFFANHPRERVGIIEKEKFPYMLLPMFLLGFFSLRRKHLPLTLLGLSPLALISIIGNSNPMGPFTLFPFLAVVTAIGIEKLNISKRLLPIALIIFALVFIQTITYTKY